MFNDPELKNLADNFRNTTERHIENSKREDNKHLELIETINKLSDDKNKLAIKMKRLTVASLILLIIQTIIIILQFCKC